MAICPVACSSYVQNLPTTRLTKTNVKTDKSYSLVFYDMFICLRTIKSEVVKTTSLFIDIDICAKPTQLIAQHN